MSSRSRFSFRRKRINSTNTSSKSEKYPYTGIQRIPEDSEDEFLYYYRQYRPRDAYPSDWVYQHHYHSNPPSLRNSFSFPGTAFTPSSVGSCSSDLPPMYRDAASSSSDYEFGSCYSSLPVASPYPPPTLYDNHRMASSSPTDDLSGMLQDKMNLLAQSAPIARDDSQSRDSGHSSSGGTGSTDSPDWHGMRRRRLVPRAASSLKSSSSRNDSSVLNHHLDESSAYSFSSARCGDEQDSGVSSVATNASRMAYDNHVNNPLGADVHHYNNISDSSVVKVPLSRCPPPSPSKSEEAPSQQQQQQQRLSNKDQTARRGLSGKLSDIARVLWCAVKSMLLICSCLLLLLSGFSYYQALICLQSQDQVLDASLLYEKLNASVFGQELATKVIVDAVGNFNQDHGHKLTVLLLLGWTGTGKSLATTIIKATFPVPSNVYSFSVPLHLNDKSNHVILEDVAMAIQRSCGPTLVVLEDVDDGTLRAIAKMEQFLTDLAKQDDLGGGGGRGNGTLVVATMASGGQAINKQMLEWARSTTFERQSISIAHINKILEDPNVALPLNDTLVQNGVRLYLVPFLPLTRDHIKQCIVHEFLQQEGGQGSKNDVYDVLKEMHFFSDAFPVFATAGCKRVAYKVGMLLASKNSFLGLA